MTTYTADSPPPCPVCGVRLAERTEPDGGEEGGMLYAYRCPACRWEDGGGYDCRRLTVADAPWTRDLWAEVVSARAEAQGEAKAADLHRNLNRRCAEALGLTTMRIDPETGEDYLPSWHDMPERIVALREERDSLAARVRELEAPGECQSLHKLREALAAMVEAVADDGPITATVAPAWDRACAVLSADWREGQESAICGFVVHERTHDSGTVSRILCPLPPGHDGDHAAAMAGDEADTDTNRSTT